MSNTRIPWDQYFMAQAVLLSLRSTCSRLEVGATLVKDRRIIAGGYNGSVSGDVHCIDDAVMLSMTIVFGRFMQK